MYGLILAATVQCADYDTVTQRLAEQFDETMVMTTPDMDGNILELYSSDTGTWTLLLNLQEEGLACMISSGSTNTVSA